MSTWILMRGLMRDARHWGNFVEQLQQHFPNDQVLTLDFLGNGEFYQQASCTGVDAMVLHCRQQMKVRAYSPPFRLVAMSLGAMVAIAWAQKAPLEIKNMVLINTSLAPLNPFYERLRPRNYFALLAMLVWKSAAKRESVILHLTTRRLDANQLETQIKEWTNFADSCATSRLNICRQLLAAMRYRAARIRPSMPTLLLVGDGDQLVNPNCSYQLAQAWELTLAQHPKAGHDLALDDAGWLLQMVCEWNANSLR